MSEQGGSSDDGSRERRDSEPKTLAVNSPLSEPIVDTEGEVQTAIADAHVLRAMIAKVQEEAARNPSPEAPDVEVPPPEDDEGELQTLPPPGAGAVPTPRNDGLPLTHPEPVPPTVDRARQEPRNSELPAQLPPSDSMASDAPTNPPPALKMPPAARVPESESTPETVMAAPSTQPLLAPEDDEDRADRTVATDSPDMMPEHTGETAMASLEMARALMREQLEAEAAGGAPPTKGPATTLDRSVDSASNPHSARVSLPGVEPDDIDPYEATIARPPGDIPGSDPRPPMSGSSPGTITGSSPGIMRQPQSSPLAGTGYRPPNTSPAALAATAYQPTGHATTTQASPLAATGYQPPGAPMPHTQAPQTPMMQPQAQPNAFPPVNQPQTLAMPMPGTVPLAFVPPMGLPPQHLQHQQQPQQQQPQAFLQTGPAMTQPQGQYPQGFPVPQQPGPLGAPPPQPMIQYGQPPRDRMQMMIIIGCVVAASIGIILILIALRH